MRDYFKIYAGRALQWKKVNITSAGGLVTFPAVGYHTVKFGLEAMSETLAKEVTPLGISVTAVNQLCGRLETLRRKTDAGKRSTRCTDLPDLTAA